MPTAVRGRVGDGHEGCGIGSDGREFVHIRLLGLQVRHPRFIMAILLVAAAMVSAMLALGVPGSAARSVVVRRQTSGVVGAGNRPLVLTGRGPVRGFVKKGSTLSWGFPMRLRRWGLYAGVRRNLTPGGIGRLMRPCMVQLARRSRLSGCSLTRATPRTVCISTCSRPGSRVVAKLGSLFWSGSTVALMSTVSRTITTGVS